MKTGTIDELLIIIKNYPEKKKQYELQILKEYISKSNLFNGKKKKMYIKINKYKNIKFIKSGVNK